MISLTVTEMEKVRGRPKTGHPILMVLDEFAGLKRMEVIETAAAQIAGYGVKLFFVLQSLEQLKAVYKDNWETFLANSGLKVFFNLEDNFSRDYVSKLIGETEVIREVRSETDSTGRSESHSVSSSTAISESDGTNSSVSSGTSGGKNWSRTKGKTNNYGRSWTPVSILFGAGQMKGNLQRNNSRSFSDSVSTGGSKGWNEGRSDGVSHGTSRSQTEGTSETTGTSESRTEGSSETIQKRALVTPDEIGQLFARIDDRAHGAYPGLALVVISGAPPVALRRVNYYEDFQFMGLFEPNPDYPQSTGPKELTVGADGMLRWRWYFENKLLKLGPWAIAQGRTVEGGFAAAPLLTSVDVAAGNLRAPRGGMISAVTSPASFGSPLFSIRYYEDGAALIDPFAEVAAYHENYKQEMIAKREKLKSSSGVPAFIALAFMIVAGAGGATVGAGAVVIGLIGVAVCLWLVFRKMKEFVALDNIVKFLEGVGK